MDTKKALRKEIGKLKNKPHVNQNTLNQFLERLEKPIGIIRNENPNDHFSCFFVPIDFDQKLVFLGHHKKADLWIPPGGHIEKDEHPINTVKREVSEELQYKINDGDIELFDLTLTNCNNADNHFHWDLWYVLNIPKTDFKYEEREFYAVSWFGIKEAVEMMTPESNKQIFRNIDSVLFKPRP